MFDRIETTQRSGSDLTITFCFGTETTASKKGSQNGQNLQQRIEPSHKPSAKLAQRQYGPRNVGLCFQSHWFGFRRIGLLYVPQRGLQHSLFKLRDRLLEGADDTLSTLATRLTGPTQIAAECPLWVNTGHKPNPDLCPLYPRKRT